MLSKVKHYDNRFSSSTNKADINLLMSALVNELSKQHRSIEVLETSPSGTLGIFFILFIDSKKKFVKTHLQGLSYKENLEKEISILSFLYKDLLAVERLELLINGEESTFLVMDYLDIIENQVIDIQTIDNCIFDYNKALRDNMEYYKKIEVNYSFNDIITEGYKSINLFHEKNILSYEVIKKCEEAINFLQTEKSKYTPILCHGDLSNVNVLTRANRFYVIDWEDAFWGFQNYDFLYWLTFFSQRKYYSRNVFKDRNIDITFGKSTMALIVLIKSALSYTRKDYGKNSISFDDRLNEIFNI